MNGVGIGVRGLRPDPDVPLPPGPRWPSLVQSIALIRFRHRFQPWLQRRYGDVFTVRMLPDGRPLVVLTRPEQAKELFAADPSVFHAGKGNAILGPVMGEHSLLLQDGDEHARARRLLMPAFNKQALREYRELVSAIAADEAAHWPADVTLRSLDRMNVLTLEVILRVVFGVTDETRLAALRPRVNETISIGPDILLGFGFPRLQEHGRWKRAVENQRELDELIYAEIHERREVGDLEMRTDVLSQLMRAGEGDDRLGDAELRDQLVTLLLAGHETTATSLAWALYELGRRSDLLARSQRAADGSTPFGPSAEDDAWLEAVVKESMRLHPVIPMVVRTLMEPATIAGLDLPKGATVGASILLAHARDSNFTEPERFDPERFVGRNPAPHTWIPFGGGVRRCIGAGFAQMEGVAILREVLRRHDVAAAGDDEPRVRNITSVPRFGARIHVMPRRAASRSGLI
ncbi:cytochrome P450 [Nocardioides sp. CBS4Y-1]|uniref:Cytochrome P450 n=2 Tax=Nocardioides acrostichi TaxID=2784339 RepID=A0A930YAD2_9ACTN|nr:cytochrome P450 [Nocardioides acrostichi]